MRYAIDKKPTYYHSVIKDEKGNERIFETGQYDWRELIY
jgi:hypothetical protein